MLRLAAIMFLYAAVEAALIAARVAPARDGGRYIRQALRFDAEPAVEVIRDSPDHPGYALLLHGAFRVGRVLGLESPREIVLVAQVASAACGLALIIIAFLTARRVVGALPATAGLAAFVLLPRPANHLSDVLSDPLHAALWMGAASLVISGIERARIRTFFIAGLVGGLAYWARMDALTLPASTAAALALLVAIRSPARWPAARAARALGAHAVGFGMVLAAFVLVKGELSGEGAARAILGDASHRDGTGRADVIVAGAGESVAEVARAVGQEVQYVHLVYLGCAIAAAFRLRRLRGGGVFAVAAAAVYAATLLVLRDRAGYVAGRYTLPLLALLVPFGLWGVLRAALDRARSRRRRRASRTVRVWVWSAVALSVALSLPSFLGHRPHDTFHGLMRAGEWVRDHAPPDRRVLDTYFFPTFVAGIPERQILEPAAAAETAPFHAIAQDRDLQHLPVLRSLIESGRAREVAVFPRRPSGDDREVRVYQVAPAGR
jgi:hypothetical protein